MERPTRRTSVPFRGSLAVGLGLITWDRLLGPHFRRRHTDVHIGADAETVLRPGCPLTAPGRTAFDLARRTPLVEAVAAVDSLARVCSLTDGHVLEVADRHVGARGLVQVRRVVELMDPRADSLPETRLRLGLADRGVPPGIPQFRIVLNNGRRVFLDLAWPTRRFGLEYNGPEHRTIAGQNRDAFRTGRLADLDWEILPVSSAMVLDPSAFDELARRVLHKVT